uniref:glutathione transferase n=1 Tax=Ixodes ricinus TaxID=34613 RepID=A0A0K8RG20_IXORI
MVLVVGYSSARGLAQSIRNLLTYKGVDFEDRRYKYGPAPNFEKPEWTKEKNSLGLQFPNLPYLIDGDVKITQSIAILRYLGRKHDLAARTPQETLELDFLEQQANDLMWGLIIVAMSPNFNEAKKFHEASLVSSLNVWSEHLRSHKWALGDRLTYVDFLLYESLDWNRHFKPDAFLVHPPILDYLKRFEELPNIKEYFASSKYSKWPILAPNFHWGFKKE